jgi:hypothetical protein
VKTVISPDRDVAASPIWLRVIDTFTRRAPEGPVALDVQRRVGARWMAVQPAYLLKSTGDVVFVNLGRVRQGRAGERFDLRIAVTAPRTLVETATGEPSLVQTVTTWTPAAPPPAPAVQEIRCYPGPDYRFGPGVPLLSGRVLDGTGDAVARAAVTVSETVLGVAVVEEVRSDDDGWFRLPLRWSAGATQIVARRLTASGTATVDVPADLGSVLLITIS